MGCAGGSSVVINNTCDATSLTVAELMNCLMNSSQEGAFKASNSASQTAARLICEAVGLNLDFDRSEELFTPTAEHLPIPDKLDNVVSNYVAQRDALIPYIGENLDDFMDKWWNVIYNPAFYAAADKLLEIIQSGVTGIPDEQEVKIWGAVETTITANALNARDDFLQSIVSRGLPVTEREMYAASLMEGRAYAAAGAARREIANKRYEIQNQNMRFAISEANKLFPQIGDRAVGYLNAFTGALNNALNSVTVDPNVLSTRINAIANLFGQDIELDKLRFTSLNALENRVMEDNRLTSSNALGRLGAINSAGSTSADVDARIALGYLSQVTNIGQLAGSE